MNTAKFFDDKEGFENYRTPTFAVLLNPSIRNDSSKNERKRTQKSEPYSFPLGRIAGDDNFLQQKMDPSPLKMAEVNLQKRFKSEIQYIDPVLWTADIPADLDVYLGKYQVNGESFWKQWRLFSISEQLLLCIKIRVIFEDLEVSAANFYFSEKPNEVAVKDSTSHSHLHPELSTQNKSYSLKIKNVSNDFCFEFGIKATKVKCLNVRSVRMSFFIEKSARELFFDRPLPLHVELNSVFNLAQWRQRQLENFQRFHRKINQFIKTSYGSLHSEEYMRRCQRMACISCRRRSMADPTFPAYCMDERCAGNIIDSDYRSMAYLEPLIKGLAGEEAGRALAKKISFNWSRWLSRDNKYRLKKDKSIIKVDALFYEACVQNKLFCPICGKTEPYLDVWFRNQAERRGKWYNSKCQTCWKHFAEPDISFDIKSFELRMKRRDQRRAEELADIAAKLEDKKVEYHPYQFINKIEEKWRRKNPTSDRNWAPNRLLNKCLPNYRLKLVESNDDLLELSDFTDSDFDQNIFEFSLSTLSAEDDGEFVVDGGQVVAVEELSVREIIDKERPEKEETIIVAEDAFLTAGNDAVVESTPNEVHILNLPCDCALCRKVALRKLAREQGPVTASMQTTEKVQGLSIQTPATSPIKMASLESLPSANEDMMEVGKSSTRKSSLRPSTATDRSSSRLVEQLRGNISKQRAVNFNAITQITDSVSSSGEKSYHKEVSVVKSSKNERERDSQQNRKAPVPNSSAHDVLKNSDDTAVKDEVGMSACESPRHTKSSHTLDLFSTGMNDDISVDEINKNASLMEDSRFNLSISPRSLSSVEKERKKQKEVQSTTKPTISVQILPISRRFQDDRSLSGLVGVLEDHIPNEEHLHQRHELWLRGVAGIIPAGALRNALNELDSMSITEMAHTSANQSLNLLRKEGFGPTNGSHTIRVTFVYDEQMRTLTAYNPVMHIGVHKLLYTNNNSTQESSQPGSDSIDRATSTHRMVYFVGCCNCGSQEKAYFFLSPLYSKPISKSSGEQLPMGFQYFQSADVVMTSSDRCEYLLEKTCLDTGNSDHSNVVSTSTGHSKSKSKSTKKPTKAHLTPFGSRNPYVSYDWKSASPLYLSGKKSKTASLPGNVFFVVNVLPQRGASPDEAAATVIMEYFFAVRCLFLETEQILHGTFLCHRYFSAEDLVGKQHLLLSSPIDLDEHAYFVVDGVRHTQRLSDGVEFLCASFQLS